MRDKDYFRYVSEFESLVDLNEGFERKFIKKINKRMQKNVREIYALNFCAYCTVFTNVSHSQIVQMIFKAIGIDVEVKQRLNL